MRVTVHRKVQQVEDGKKYQGSLQMGATTLDYEIDFTIPIPDLDSAPPVEGIKAVRECFPITIRKGGQVVPITDEEYPIFFGMIAGYAAEFYNMGQTRDHNASGLASMLEAVGGSMSLSLEGPVTFDLPSKIVTTLNQPKFGCNLQG